jgi:mannose-6-phosphate isomerase-like protein (cupin superfamily)
MSLIRQVEIRSLDSFKGGMVEFYTPQSSHETILVQIAPHTIDDVFVHHFQTDQLLVVRGSFVLVILQNRQYRYIPLSQDYPQVVTIPPGVPHGAINVSSEPCVLVNAVLRHGAPHERDYLPIKQPFPYDLHIAQTALEQLNLSATV